MSYKCLMQLRNWITKPIVKHPFFLIVYVCVVYLCAKLKCTLHNILWRPLVFSKLSIKGFILFSNFFELFVFVTSIFGLKQDRFHYNNFEDHQFIKLVVMVFFLIIFKVLCVFCVCFVSVTVGTKCTPLWKVLDTIEFCY